MTFVCPSASGLMVRGWAVAPDSSEEFSCLERDSQRHCNSLNVVWIFLLQFLTVVEVARQQ